MDAMGDVVVKSTYKNDLRRFRCEKNIRYEKLISMISQLYSLNSFIVKYVDDEGDFISVTCDAELSEALRLTAANRNPTGSVLRLTVFETKSANNVASIASSNTEKETQPVPISHDKVPVEAAPLTQKHTQPPIEVPSNVTIVEIFEVITDKDQTKSEESEYPPLSIDDWVPIKLPTSPNAEPVATETIRIPRSGSQTVTEACNAESKKIRSECEAESDSTLKDSLEFSKRTRDDCMKYVQMTLSDTAEYSREHREQPQYQRQESDSKMLMTLSDEIAVQCKELSDDTMRTLGQMVHVSVDVDASGWQEMSTSIGNECLLLCEKTSRETVELCRQESQNQRNFVQYEEKSRADVRNQCLGLSNETTKNCHDLSNKTTDDCSQISKDIARMILEL